MRRLLFVALISCSSGSDGIGVATAAPTPSAPTPPAAHVVQPASTAPADPPAPDRDQLVAGDCNNGSGTGAGTQQIEGSSGVRDTFTLTRAKYADLPGWADDPLAEAIPAFLLSCGKLGELADDDPVGADGHGGTARQWRHACAAAAKLTGDDAAARKMFETEFDAYTISGKAGTTGKLTAYDVQEMHASRTRHGKYKYPIYARPDDLVTIDLSKFTNDAHGRHVWGRLDATGELVPYYTRKEIRTGILDAKHLELMYADDAVDVIFAQIEGSAKARMDDGSTVWLEFAGKNGRAFKGIGGVLRGSGELGPGQGTMQGIRKWFVDHASRFDEIADQDASYVFFKESKEPGAIGTQKTVLTAKRSLAVDRAFIAMSTPVFVDTHAPIPGKAGVAPWQHLLIAQDTGGGITGAVRGDIYWGDDAEASELGGRMGGPGREWLLLPKGVAK
jgi:membrane-bound lytic murein transglycosylase A